MENIYSTLMCSAEITVVHKAKFFYGPYTLEETHNNKENFKKISNRDKLWWILRCAAQTTFSDEGLALGALVVGSLALSAPLGCAQPQTLLEQAQGGPCAKTHQSRSTKAWPSLIHVWIQVKGLSNCRVLHRAAVEPAP